MATETDEKKSILTTIKEWWLKHRKAGVLTAIFGGLIAPVMLAVFPTKKWWLANENRIKGVGICAAAGVVLAILWLFIYSVFGGESASMSGNTDSRIKSGIFFTLLILPLSFYLWFLRNHDKIKQIKQADESNRFNSFSNAMKLFLDKEHKESSAIGLNLLMKLKHEKVFEDEIDLATSRQNLDGLDLSESDLSGVNFKKTRLQQATLLGVDLSKANLFEANLSEARLRGATLYRADMSSADLSKANLFDANLSLAFLSHADLSGASLFGANLSEADLSYADLSEANLCRADLSGANMSKANLSRASLSAASLKGAKLAGISLYVAENHVSHQFSRNGIERFLTTYREEGDEADRNVEVEILENDDQYYFVIPKPFAF